MQSAAFDKNNSSSFYEKGRTCPQVFFAAMRTGFYSWLDACRVIPPRAALPADSRTRRTHPVVLQLGRGNRLHPLRMHQLQPFHFRFFASRNPGQNPNASATYTSCPRNCRKYFRKASRSFVTGPACTILPLASSAVM
jgi:hypothetical protein